MDPEDNSTLPLSGQLRQRLDTLGLEFQAGFLAAEALRHPRNMEALAELGEVYTRLGRHADGLSIDQELSRMLPEDATIQYNLACSLALVGRIDAALDALECAVRLGYDDPEHLRDDSDLCAIKGEPRFQRLLDRLVEGT